MTVKDTNDTLEDIRAHGDYSGYAEDDSRYTALQEFGNLKELVLVLNSVRHFGDKKDSLRPIPGALYQ